MTDITERLRRLYVQHGTDYVQAAADEIERLRDALTRRSGLYTRLAEVHEGAMKMWESDERECAMKAYEMAAELKGLREEVERLRAELELHKGALIAEQEHVETLEAELAACREDAERYRWLREHWDDVNHPVDFIICNSFVTTLDADVDAARKGEVET